MQRGIKVVVCADAELSLCFNDVRDDPDIGVVILTGDFTCNVPFSLNTVSVLDDIYTSRSQIAMAVHILSSMRHRSSYDKLHVCSCQELAQRHSAVEGTSQ